MGKICSFAVEKLDNLQEALLPDVLRNSDSSGVLLATDSCAGSGGSRRVYRGFYFHSFEFEQYRTLEVRRLSKVPIIQK